MKLFVCGSGNGDGGGTINSRRKRKRHAINPLEIYIKLSVPSAYRTHYAIKICAQRQVEWCNKKEFHNKQHR